MAVLKNRAKMSTSTTGTGTITLGSALTGYQSFATAGVTNGDQVRYTIQEGADWELGLGTYTASGTTLSRTPSESSNGGSAIVLTGNAEVFITAAAGDILQPANNLSDLANAGTSRTNLGVAIGSDVQAYSSVLANTTASYTTAEETKLSGIETGADVTDTANVTSAGAAMTANNLSDLANAGTSRTNLGVAIGSDVQAYSSVLQNTTASFLTADETKLDYISVTQAVDLDQMETDIAALANGMVYKGNWDASSGSFPGGGSAQTGWFYYVSVAGTVGGVSFAIGDNIVATTDNASTSTFAGNWSKHDQTDAVQAVVGLTGSIAKGSLLAALNVEDGADVTDAGNVNPLVDTHLNTSTATAGEFLSWDGSDYDWTAAGAPLYAGNESSPFAQPSATGTNAIAIGDSATASATRSLALGTFSTASGVNSVAIGFQSVASTTAIAVGKSYASGDNSFAASIDNNTASYGALGEDSVAMGKISKAQSQYDVAIGYSALATGTGSIALGFSRASGYQSAALNTGNAASGGAAHESSVAIGYGATTTATKQIALGSGSAQVKVSGAYTLPTSDGTAGTALVTDGSGALSFAAVGAELYAANPVSATDPTASGNNAVAIGSGAVASGTNTLAFGNADATASSAMAIGTISLASGYGSQAIGFQTDATADYACAIGGYAQATAVNAFAFGYDAQASGVDSLTLGQGNVSGVNATGVGIGSSNSTYAQSGLRAFGAGYYARATNQDTISIGPYTQAAGQSSISIGRYAACNSSAVESISIGVISDATQRNAIALGYNAQATADSSVAIGKNSTTGGIIGKYAFANDVFVSPGDVQKGTYVLHVSTTNATSIALTSKTGVAASATNQVNLQNNSAYAFHGTIVARQKASEGTASAAWKIEGLIRREANAGTTVLVNSATTVLDNTPAWGMALTADTTNGCLKVEVTGAAATNIRWVATINTSELTYA